MKSFELELTALRLSRFSVRDLHRQLPIPYGRSDQRRNFEAQCIPERAGLAAVAVVGEKQWHFMETM